MSNKNIKKRYYSKGYSNSMFNTGKIASQKRKQKKTIRLVILIFFLIAFLVSFYFLLFGSYFKINSITITGNKKLKTDDILVFVNNYFEKDKKSAIFWMLDTTDLSEKLSVFFDLRDVTISKELPNKLEIKMIEREPGFVLNINNKKSYLLDKQGVLIRPILNKKNETLLGLPIVIDYTLQNNIDIHGRGLSAIDIVFLYKVSNFLSKISVNEKFFVKEGNNNVSVVLDGDKKILFSLSENIDNQIRKLESIFSDSLDIDKYSEYIDLRFGDKVYYK